MHSEQHKFKRVELWVDGDEKAALEAAAKNFHVSPETYLHMLVFGDCWMPKLQIAKKNSKAALVAGVLALLLAAPAHAEQVALDPMGETSPTINQDRKPNEWGVYELASCPDGFSLVMQSADVHCVQIVAEAAGAQNATRK